MSMDINLILSGYIKINDIISFLFLHGGANNRVWFIFCNTLSDRISFKSIFILNANINFFKNFSINQCNLSRVTLLTFNPINSIGNLIKDEVYKDEMYL